MNIEDWENEGGFIKDTRHRGRYSKGIEKNSRQSRETSRQTTRERKMGKEVTEARDKIRQDLKQELFIMKVQVNKYEASREALREVIQRIDDAISLRRYILRAAKRMKQPLAIDWIESRAINQIVLLERERKEYVAQLEETKEQLEHRIEIFAAELEEL